MSELQYEIALETPLGPRKGRLLLTVAENTCTGILEVMRERNPVTGTISKDGQCHLTGNIRTLLHSRAFTADGKCLPETVNLILHYGRIPCSICGQTAAL